MGVSKSRAYHLKAKFGMTTEQYDELLEKQGGTCALCPKTPEDEGQYLAVDHDHVSMEVRGILCRYCNHRVIGRHRDADLLRRMADYLDSGHTGWFVPKKKRRSRKAASKRKPRGI
jgi:DNA-directed RNA polymerase subunit RPC12/RpoP